MEMKKPRHLTASGKLKPSVRRAHRNVTKDGRVPTYISAALFNRFQEEVAQSLYSASPVTSVTSMPANECLSLEEGSAPVIVAGVDVQRAGILVSARERK